HFARKIAQLLGTGFGFVPMSSLTAGWVLSGASSQWKNAKPGKVFDTFLNGDYANPVIVVDELDKASSDGQYDPLGALYELLEVETSTRFVDEFVELPIDASGALWLATANDAARIPDPLLNRLSIYEIEAPDAAGSARIAATIYREICRNPGYQRYLAVGDRAEDDRRRLEPVFELVHGLAQGLRIGALESGGQHFGALHVDRLRGKVLALARRQLRLESRQLPLERALFLALGPELVLQRRALGLEKILHETLVLLHLLHPGERALAGHRLDA